MNLTNIGNYVVHYKAINTNSTQATPAVAGAASTAPVAIPPSMLHMAVHQPTGQRCLLQVLEKRDPRDGSALAREVKAQLLVQSLPDSSPFLRLREVLQDREQQQQQQQQQQLAAGAGAVGASFTGGRGLKRKATGDATVDHARTTAATTSPAVHKYYLMYEGFREGEACDLLEFTKLVGKVPEPLAKSLFAQLLEAVSSLHDLGIIHGDLKLPNVLVAREQASGGFKLKVKDFRYSTVLTPGSPRPGGDQTHGAVAVRPPPGTVVTEKGDLLVTTHKGSPAYLAPEVTLLNQPFDGKKADAYSLGVILYTMLYGCYPITAHSLTDLFELIKKGDIAFPDMGLSENAVDLVKRLLERDSAARFTLKEALRHPWVYSPTSDEEQIVPAFFTCAVAAAEAKKAMKVKPETKEAPAASVC